MLERYRKGYPKCLYHFKIAEYSSDDRTKRTVRIFRKYNTNTSDTHAISISNSYKLKRVFV